MRYKTIRYMGGDALLLMRINCKTTFAMQICVISSYLHIATICLLFSNKRYV